MFTSTYKTKLRGLSSRANYTDRPDRVPHGQRDGSLRPYSLFSRPEQLLSLPSNSSIVFTRLSGPRSRPTTSQKICYKTKRCHNPERQNAVLNVTSPHSDHWQDNQRTAKRGGCGRKQSPYILRPNPGIFLEQFRSVRKLLNQSCPMPIRPQLTINRYLTLALKRQMVRIWGSHSGSYKCCQHCVGSLFRWFSAPKMQVIRRSETCSHTVLYSRKWQHSG
jgi:hypothetical protein